MSPPDPLLTEISAYDAKTRLPELLRQVEAGARDVSAAIDHFLALANAHPVREPVPIKEWIEDGRE